MRPSGVMKAARRLQLRGQPRRKALLPAPRSLLIPEGNHRIKKYVRVALQSNHFHSGRRDLLIKAKGARDGPEVRFDSAAKGRMVNMRVADGSRCKSGTVAPL